MIRGHRGVTQSLPKLESEDAKVWPLRPLLAKKYVCNTIRIWLLKAFDFAYTSLRGALLGVFRL